MKIRIGVLRSYARALRAEPKLRAYAVASLIDDIGVAVSVWGTQLLFTKLFVDQTQRAKFMVPTLICFLVGSLISGPLADWVRDSLAHLARWRWRLVVWARLIETVALGLAIWGVSRQAVTIYSIMPYAFITAFMKTGLRPTRRAFEVDLLTQEEIQCDAQNQILLDERGQPRRYKIHLLAYSGLTSFLNTAAVLSGLLLGGLIMKSVGGQFWALLAFDVLTNLGFIAIVLFYCHPDRSAREIGWRDLRGEREPTSHMIDRAHEAHRSLVAETLREIFLSFREAAQFLRRAEQRPLLCLLVGVWIVEVVNEFYDGQMITKQILHGSDDSVRYAELLWSAASLVIVALFPALARRVGSLGKIFLAIMFLDGLLMALAGKISALGTLGAILPFIAVIAADRGLTEASGALSFLVQSSASSAAIRGRIMASLIIVVIISDLFAELLATALANAYGIPGMLFRIGLAQVFLVFVIAAFGGKRLWNFGLRSTPDPSISTESVKV